MNLYPIILRLILVAFTAVFSIPLLFGQELKINDFNRHFYHHLFYDGFVYKESLIPYSEFQPHLNYALFHPEKINKQQIQKIKIFKQDTSEANLNFVYLFDSTGHLTASEKKGACRLFYNSENLLDSVYFGDTLPPHKYTYDSLGHLIRLELSDSQYYQWKFKGNFLIYAGYLRNDSVHQEFGLEYNADSTLRKFMWYEDSLITDHREYIYDSLKRVIRINHCFFDELLRYEIIEYAGNHIKKTMLYTDRKLKKTAEWRVNENGQIVFHRIYRATGRNIFTDGKDYIRKLKQYSVYENGILKSGKIKYRQKGKLFRQRRSWEFEYENGLLYKEIYKNRFKKSIYIYQYGFYS